MTESTRRPDSTEADTGERYRTLDTGALRALAHPLRVQIFDLLTQLGPQTASSLAELMGESSGSTSYHLRALAKHGIIQEVSGRGTARERWWERPAGGLSLTNPEAMKTPAGLAATQVVMSEFLNRRHQQLMEYVARGLKSDPEEWQKGAMIATAHARLTVAQAEELTTQLQMLIDETVEKYRSQEGDGVRPVTMRVDVFPLSTDRY